MMVISQTVASYMKCNCEEENNFCIVGMLIELGYNICEQKILYTYLSLSLY